MNFYYLISIESYFISQYGGTFFVPLDEDGNDIPEAVKANKDCLKKSRTFSESRIE